MVEKKIHEKLQTFIRHPKLLNGTLHRKPIRPRAKVMSYTHWGGPGNQPIIQNIIL